jgi:hypothetical protein
MKADLLDILKRFYLFGRLPESFWGLSDQEMKIFKEFSNEYSIDAIVKEIEQTENSVREIENSLKILFDFAEKFIQDCLKALSIENILQEFSQNLPTIVLAAFRIGFFFIEKPEISVAIKTRLIKFTFSQLNQFLPQLFHLWNFLFEKNTTEVIVSLKKKKIFYHFFFGRKKLNLNCWILFSRN